MPSIQHEQMIEDVRTRLLVEVSSIEEYRGIYARFLERFEIAEAVRFQDRKMAGIDCEAVESETAPPSRTVLYVHGGGFMLGSARSYRNFMSRIAQATGSRLICVNYRLAPEHPFPAGLDDLFAVYKALLAEVADPKKLAVAGDSAGGCLALALLMRLRDSGVQLPEAAFFFSAQTDLTGSVKSLTERAALDPLVNPAVYHSAAAQYAGGQLYNPYASPLQGTFTGLPRMLFMAGTREALFDESAQAVEKANAAGGRAKLIVKEGLIHVWPLFGPDLPESAATLQDVAQFLQQT
jgi:epsilon-lactone hydrolase